jgi:Protein of unknown function DUF262
MKTNPVTMTIADLCGAFERDEVQIDSTYQRSPDVWPVQARSYLIETILKGFPIPKLALHQVTDLKSKQTTKFVVDGQQRSGAILAFYNNKLRLSRTIELSEAANKRYDDLSKELQEAFLSYLVHFDQFEASSDEDVREYFRRINSFTAPLNAEEQRHARYRGPMKWFIQSLRDRHGEALVNLGVLQKKSVVRMADAKFFAEIVHALLFGVTTTNKRSLDSMYKQYDKGDEVPGEAQLRSAIDNAIDAVLAWPSLNGTAMMRMNVFYSLALALILVQRKWPKLTSIGASYAKGKVAAKAETNLLRLASALDEPEVFEDYKEFTLAADEKTNVKGQREKRIKWLARALSSKDI